MRSIWNKIVSWWTSIPDYIREPLWIVEIFVLMTLVGCLWSEVSCAFAVVVAIVSIFFVMLEFNVTNKKVKEEFEQSHTKYGIHEDTPYIGGFEYNVVFKGWEGQYPIYEISFFDMSNNIEVYNDTIVCHSIEEQEKVISLIKYWI